MSGGIADRRQRLYANYATTHSGKKTGLDEARLFARDILPHLPQGRRGEHVVIDVGCGQGRLIEQLLSHGYTLARGIDISPEQIELARAAGVANVECGDYKQLLERRAGACTAVVATDFLEHFSKDEILPIFDQVKTALVSGGVFIVRSPNATSPFFGNYQYGDFTHEVTFTPRSFAQLAAAAGFSRTEAFACPPMVHGCKSAVRAAIWSVGSSLLRVALAAETGRTNHIVTQNFVGVATT